mmetsp:Transcript_7947/g.12630  ORF Transcript_7947/g.12630 Transcript_7947/m.12630 type:complete len:221 (+) Transcript_7947:144-806(+)
MGASKSAQRRIANMRPKRQSTITWRLWWRSTSPPRLVVEKHRRTNGIRRRSTGTTFTRPAACSTANSSASTPSARRRCASFYPAVTHRQPSKLMPTLRLGQHSLRALARKPSLRLTVAGHCARSNVSRRCTPSGTSPVPRQTRVWPRCATQLQRWRRRRTLLHSRRARASRARSWNVNPRASKLRVCPPHICLARSTLRQRSCRRSLMQRWRRLMWSKRG